MAIEPELLGVFSGIVSSLISVGIYHGVQRTRIEQLEWQIKNKVDSGVFEATLRPIHDDLSEMKNDLKELLKVVQRHDKP